MARVERYRSARETTSMHAGTNRVRYTRGCAIRARKVPVGARVSRQEENTSQPNIAKAVMISRQRRIALPLARHTRNMAEGSPTLTRMPSLANWVNPSASATPRPSRESISPERQQEAAVTFVPTGRFGFPTQAMLAAAQGQAHGEEETEDPPPPSPPPEFAGVFKPRVKPKLPLDHVVMMHQAYVDTNPRPKSWDEGPPLDNGGASVGPTSDAKEVNAEREPEGGAAPEPDTKDPPVSPRKRKVPAAKKAPEVSERRVSRRLQNKT